MTRQIHIFQKTALIIWVAIVGIFIIGIPRFTHADEQKTFYIRLDIKVVNGREVENNLLMLPSDDEFRITNFKKYNVTGTCPSDAKPDPYSAAKHDAFKDLLRSFGVKSIRNKSESQQNHLHEESVLSYEGFIKSSYAIVSEAFDHEKKVLTVQMKIDFAPLAYPSEWRFRYFKKKLYDTIKNMVSVFL